MFFTVFQLAGFLASSAIDCTARFTDFFLQTFKVIAVTRMIMRSWSAHDFPFRFSYSKIR